jgi:hypothetical protein
MADNQVIQENPLPDVGLEEVVENVIDDEEYEETENELQVFSAEPEPTTNK